MSLDDKKLKADAFVRLSQSNDGRAFLNEISADFDGIMQKLLYAKPDELQAVQGHARGLHEILKKISDAHKLLNS